ncbi:MAG: response regulator transcription factor [Eubacteriales bacterium]|nr:response regulator transcription factor [Eubacteriales bacterium]
MAQRIFIVEDDSDLAHAIASTLESWQFEAKICSDFENVLTELHTFNPQLILLDINLPLFNGYHWCTRIREESQLPIMIVSAKTDPLNQVMGLELGADDYLEKPFSAKVLVAKVKALLRRTYTYTENDASLDYAGLSLEPEAARVTYAGRKANLSLNELRILAQLLAAKGSFVSRDKLIAELWGQSEFVSDNTLSVNLSRLRKKLSDLIGYDIIISKKGLGYAVREGGAE